MKTVRTFGLIIFTLIFWQCKKSVVIEAPFPTKAVYCQINNDLLGRWQSDSTWILTHSDSLDSVFVNTRPTHIYNLSVSCSADTQFLLEYTNFSGVNTQEFYSQNFISTDSAIILYGELDFDRTDIDAEGRIHYSRLSDSTMLLEYGQRLNNDQDTEILVWLKSQN